MTDIKDIGWGHYLDYEGPFYRGNQPYTLPDNPSLEQCYLAVITATEGGSYNAVNMYDRCGVSVGLMQWCEFGQFSVSALLGEVSRELPLVLPREHDYFLALANTKGGRNWRFYATQGGIPVDTISGQRKLFFLNATGELGSWDDDSKEYAKAWAAFLASVFEDETAKRVQLKFTTDRLDSFVLQPARVLDPSRMPAGLRTDPWALVAYAAYLSFAANNPTIACKMFQAYDRTVAFRPTDRIWVVGLLRQLTFGPKITIYPARYNAIRPVLEKLFGVDLPDFQYDLYRWGPEVGIDPSDPADIRLDTTIEVQKALLKLGYDLGPAGADGRFGPKTRRAVVLFQKAAGLTVDGIIGPLTRRALVQALSKWAKE